MQFEKNFMKSNKLKLLNELNVSVSCVYFLDITLIHITRISQLKELFLSMPMGSGAKIVSL